jgi:hypothetical protein
LRRPKIALAASPAEHGGSGNPAEHEDAAEPRRKGEAVEPTEECGADALHKRILTPWVVQGVKVKVSGGPFRRTRRN